MKLELKHIAPYQEHGVKLTDKHNNTYNIAYLSTKRIAFIDVNGFGGVEKLTWEYASGVIKPILRPLSDLTKEGVDVNGYEGYFHYLEETYINHTEDISHLKRIVNEDDRWMYSLPVYLYNHLLEWHFDIFNLIPANLAIDINTLNK